MPAYHSKIEQQEDSAWDSCGSAMLPLKTAVRGPAVAAPNGNFIFSNLLTC